MVQVPRDGRDQTRGPGEPEEDRTSFQEEVGRKGEWDWAGHKK